MKLAYGLAAAGLAAASVLGGVAGAAGALTIAPAHAAFTVTHCTVLNGDYGCPVGAAVAFRVNAPANTYGGGIVSCAYNRDQDRAIADFIREIPSGGKASNSHCEVVAEIADGEPSEGLVSTGSHVAQGYIWNDNRDGLVKSNAVHFTVTDECKLTVKRGFTRKPPQATLRVGQPFPCAGYVPADQLRLSSPFGDVFDLHGCGYLTNRSAFRRYVYTEVDLVGGSRATPESHCKAHGRLRPGNLTISTARRGFARGILAISANWGVVFLPNAPVTIVLTYDDSKTTLHVVRGAAVLGARTFNEKRDGPGLFGTKDAPEACHPLSSACVLRSYMRRFKRTRLLRAGQTSTTSHGNLPTAPR